MCKEGLLKFFDSFYSRGLSKGVQYSCTIYNKPKRYKKLQVEQKRINNA